MATGGTIHIDVVAEPAWHRDGEPAWHLDDDTIERIAQRVAELLKPSLKLTIDPVGIATIVEVGNKQRARH